MCVLMFVSHTWGKGLKSDFRILDLLGRDLITFTYNEMRKLCKNYECSRKKIQNMLMSEANAIDTSRLKVK